MKSDPSLDAAVNDLLDTIRTAGEEYLRDSKANMQDFLITEATKRMKQLSEITHPELVAALVKPGQDIINGLTPRSAHLWHMASCVGGEAGELFDAIKKLAIYGKEIDLTNVIEELGDIEFYLEGLRADLKITREETLTANIAKLSKRYVGLTYSDQSAQERLDKAVEQATVIKQDFERSPINPPPAFVHRTDCPAASGESVCTCPTRRFS